MHGRFMNKYRMLKAISHVRGIALFIGFFLVPVLIIVILNSVVSYFLDPGRVRDILNDQITFLSIQYGSFFLLFLIMFKFFRTKIDFIGNENWFLSLGKALFPSIKAFLTGLIAIYIIYSLVNLLPADVFIKKWFNTPNYGFFVLDEYIKSKAHFKVLFLFSIIVVFTPIYEEILFRGFLFDSLHKIFKRKKVVIVLIAFIFALFHIQSLSNMVFAFTVGIYLAYYRQKERSINVSVWIHAVINFTGLISGLFYNYFSKNYL